MPMPLKGNLRTSVLEDGSRAYYARIRSRTALIGHSPHWNEARATAFMTETLIPAARLSQAWWELTTSPRAAGPAGDSGAKAGGARTPLTFHELTGLFKAEIDGKYVEQKTLEEAWTPVEKHLLPFYAYEPGDTHRKRPRLVTDIDRELVVAFVARKRQEALILKALRERLRQDDADGQRSEVYLRRHLGAEQWMLLQRYGQCSKETGRWSLSSGGLSESGIRRCNERLRELMRLAEQYRPELRLVDPTRGVTVGSNRRSRNFLMPSEFDALLAAARRLDERESGHGGGDYRQLDRAGLITVLALGVPRVSELAQLRWAQVMPGWGEHGGFEILDSKTGESRIVRMVPAMRAVFDRRQDSSRWIQPHDFVWPTYSGSGRSGDSVRSRILRPVIEEAQRVGAQIPDKITPHSLRRTGLSWMAWVGVPQPEAMAIAGQSTARLTLEIYMRPIPSGGAERASAAQWLGLGTESEA